MLFENISITHISVGSVIVAVLYIARMDWRIRALESKKTGLSRDIGEMNDKLDVLTSKFDTLTGELRGAKIINGGKS